MTMEKHGDASSIKKRCSRLQLLSNRAQATALVYAAMLQPERDLHMIAGDGETSYAKNSRSQKKAMLIALPVLEKAVTQVYGTLLPKTMVVADLGCSSGPNSLLFVSKVINAISVQAQHHKLCRHDPLELQFFLNDLPGSDFNQLFRSLEQLKKLTTRNHDGETPPYYISGLPGSFYTRIFPSQTVHLFHSSCCMHWLSQVPEGLQGEGGAYVNRDNIYITKDASPLVVKLFQEQFHRDFSLFLKLRYEELVSGGQMGHMSGALWTIPSFIYEVYAKLHVKLEEKLQKKLFYQTIPDTATGETDTAVFQRSHSHSRSRHRQSLNKQALSDFIHLLGLLAESLHALVAQGLVEKEKLDSFDVPIYQPSVNEVKAIVKQSELFDFDHAQLWQTNWDPFDDSEGEAVNDSVQSGVNVAKYTRAAFEPLIASHFGEAILDALFTEYARRLGKHLEKEKAKHFAIIMSLKKRG